MLPPHLLPTEADLLKCGYIAVVAALTVGTGFLAGARRLETAFFTGWGLACLIFVAAGTWFQIDLGIAAAMVGLLGAIGWARRLARPRTKRLGDDRFGVRVLLIGAPFMFLVLGMSDIGWDDFSFWVPNLLHLSTTHQFPTLAQPTTFSAMPAYPYGLALPGFAVYLLGGSRVETVAFVWNLLAMLAAGAAFANVLVRRIRAAGQPCGAGTLWAVATLGVLLEGMANPAFVAKITLSNMGDSATGAGLAVLSALLFEWAAETQDAHARGRILREISLTACAIVFVRQENPALIALLFLSVAAGLVLFQFSDRLRRIATLSATLVLPLFIWYSWIRYGDVEIPHGSHYVLPWQQWHWSLFGTTIASAVHVLIGKPGFVLMAAVVGYVAARAVLSRIRGTNPPPDQTGVASRLVTTAVAGLAFGNIAFLFFCYLATSFNAVETTAAISFWRFIAQTGQALMIGFACFVPIRWLTAAFPGAWLPRILPVAGFLLPIAVFSTYRDDLTSSVPHLLMIAENIHQRLDADQPIVLVDMSGNGFAALVVRYQLAVIEGERRPISVIASPHGIAPAEASALSLPSNAYVWLAEGSPAFADAFGSDTTAGCSYLFTRQSGAFHLVKDWAVTPSHRIGATPACAG
jgi:hypothetical protein